MTLMRQRRSVHNYGLTSGKLPGFARVHNDKPLLFNDPNNLNNHRVKTQNTCHVVKTSPFFNFLDLALQLFCALQVAFLRIFFFFSATRKIVRVFTSCQHFEVNQTEIFLNPLPSNQGTLWPRGPSEVTLQTDTFQSPP